MPQKITDDELLSRVEQELRAAQDYIGGKLSAQRRRALQYYMGQPEGELAPPEVDGRSSFVSTDVADTVEWMLPSLLRIFTASDRVVSLTPRKPGAEQMAEDATDYLNYIFTAQNEGFLALHTMFKDALISKAGVLKIWWDDRIDEAREEYRGLSDHELAQLLEDEEVEPIEHEARPDEQDAKHREQALQQMGQQLAQAQQAAQQGNPQAQQAAMQLQQQMAGIQAQPPVMVHDVTVKRTKKAGQVRIEPVPPEEFFVSRAAKRISEAPFVAHVVERTVSDLRAQGYDIDDDELSSDESGMVGRSQERVQRWSYDDSTAPFPNMIEPPNDPSMRRVWVCEAYLRADVDGDGIAEWRRVLKVGRKLLDNVECDGPPFVAVTPIPMPHRLFGLSVADQAMEVQKHKTAMIRAIQDNMYLQVNGRYFAVEGQVNLDDLLTSRPGGVVRVKQPTAVGALQQGMADMGDAYQLLEFMEVQKENRTGWSRQSAGGDATNAINKTATGVSIVTNRADMRLELIARVFAETGVRDLFVQILKLVCQYQDQSAQFNLNGRWLEVNPREWRHQFDVTVNVGLGTNDPHIKMQQIGALMQMQQQLAAAGTGIVTPEEAYHSALEMVKALGYKSADRFLKNPAQHPPPQQPNPEQIKAQAQMQVEQMKLQQSAQLDQAKREHEMQLEQAKMQMQAEVDTNRQRAEAEQKALESRQQVELDVLKSQHEAEKHLREIEFQRWKAQLDSETRILVAQIAAQTKLDAAQVAAAESFEDEEAREPGGTQE